MFFIFLILDIVIEWEARDNKAMIIKVIISKENEINSISHSRV